MEIYVIDMEGTFLFTPSVVLVWDKKEISWALGLFCWGLEIKWDRK